MGQGEKSKHNAGKHKREANKRGFQDREQKKKKEMVRVVLYCEACFQVRQQRNFEGVSRR